MEYVPNGSMFHLMKNTNGMEEKLLRTYFGMIVEAVEFMHRNNVVHNRIQVENILLD
jgi:serine/threonine protein kinase